MKRNYSNLQPVGGVTHLECPICGKTSKVTLTLSDVYRIRAAGGGTAFAQCLFGNHGHTVKYQVWSPSQEV
jgi:hypothetical protein